MTERRVDPLDGRPVYIAGGRQTRPNLPVEGCPFCPGGLEAPDDYDVRWFVNRWPAMPDDRCEVILYSPRHDAAFWELGADGAAKVIELWAARTEELGARADVAYVMPFENRGPAVGATIPHPHGQLYAFDEVPPAPLAELEPADTGAPCAVCTEAAGAGSVRTVSATDGAIAWTPIAPSWPFELIVAPTEHLGDLIDLRRSPDIVRALASVLVDSLRRLDALFDAPMPYMLWVHQRPCTDDAAARWPRAHVHVHVAPLFRSAGVPRYVAAGELGSGVYYNPVGPEDAADRLRNAGGNG